MCKNKGNATATSPVQQEQGWVELGTKKKSFAQAAAGPALPSPPTTKTFPREEREVVLPGSSTEMGKLSPCLHHVDALFTEDLVMCGKRSALPLQIRLSKKLAIVITTSPKAPASYIQENVATLLPQIASISGTP